mgnify:CR=1 FL=1
MKADYQENDTRYGILKQIVNNLPETPGCYQYIDSTGEVIYVGKAKNLKRRVSSYFNKDQISTKTRKLVSRIHDIKYAVVKTEWDALLLENNLIKRYKPKYNILLKDDKTYPSICITKEEFPRVFKTRNRKYSNSTYFGPYSNVSVLNSFLELIGRLYRIRNCRLKLTEEDISKGKFRSCLECQIRKCNAPCIGNESAAEYNRQVEEITDILSGKSTELIRKLQEKMRQAADCLEFEKAEDCRHKISLLTSFREKSQVVTDTNGSIDVFSTGNDEETVFINYMHITDGCINQVFTYEICNRMDEPQEELLENIILEIREKYSSDAKEIVMPFKPEFQIEGVKYTVPVKGEKKKLLNLSELNVKQYRADRLKRSEKLNPEQRNVKLLRELQKILNLNGIPYRIECFDNSHLQGSDAVAACVVFENAKPARNRYRHFTIKSGSGGDDYASMSEIIERRYRRVLEEQDKLPDLLIVDGGKGQMKIASEVCSKLGINLNIAGLVKNGHHRTSALLFGDPVSEVGIKPDSELFRFLERMQNEVHRFAINFHKKKRSTRQIQTELTGIGGIGTKSATVLLSTLKSVSKIREADLKTLSGIVGNSKAQKIYSYFHTDTDADERAPIRKEGVGETEFSIQK